MKTSLDTAIQLLKEESVIALPADTLYGFSASIYSTKAIKKIFSLKKRDQDKPFIILVSSFSELKNLTKPINHSIEDILKKCFPGSNTFIFSANEKVPKIVSANFDTIAIRIPECPLVRNIIEKTGPLVSTSINIQNSPPAKTEEEITEVFGEDFPIFFSQKPLKNTPSSVVNTTLTPWKFERKTETSKKIFPIIRHMLQCN